MKENQTPETVPSDINELDENQIPSHVNVYESKQTDVVKEDEITRGVKNFEAVKSKLTGIEIPAHEFVHNNMQPFYRGSLKQDTRWGSTGNILETYGARTDEVKPKREQPSMFQPEQNVNNINGMQSQTNDLQLRYKPGKIQNNVLPFQQIKVGPGMDNGFCPNPTGGFQQFEIQELAKKSYYDVDETRIASKPKQTFEGRILEGKYISKQGKVGTLEKNRPDTHWEQTPDMYFKTTGAVTKESGRPEFPDLVEETQREAITVEYTGAPMIQTAKQTTDYGKSAILIDANERDTTGGRTYESNISTVLKAFIAPLLDAVKSSKKELSVLNPREYGQLGHNIPSKLTVKDPNDILRTTIKETLIHDSRQGNFKGSSKLTTKDPNDVMRTTIKETLIHDTTVNNVVPTNKGTIVYDPKVVAKTTIRQTTDKMDYTRNIQNNNNASFVYDPSCVARTTVKETTLAHKDGNINAKERTNLGYVNTNYEMKSTEKELTADNERIGAPNKETGLGYKIANYDAKETEKENPIEYFGTGVDTKNKQAMSYDDIYNARIDELKETVVVGNQDRIPTLSGAKVRNSDINLTNQRSDENPLMHINHGKPIQNTLDSCSLSHLTKTRNEYDKYDNGNGDRLNVSILALDTLKSNPYQKAIV